MAREPPSPAPILLRPCAPGGGARAAGDGAREPGRCGTNRRGRGLRRPQRSREPRLPGTDAPHPGHVRRSRAPVRLLQLRHALVRERRVPRTRAGRRGAHPSARPARGPRRDAPSSPRRRGATATCAAGRPNCAPRSASTAATTGSTSPAHRHRWASTTTQPDRAATSAWRPASGSAPAVSCPGAGTLSATRTSRGRPEVQPVLLGADDPRVRSSSDRSVAWTQFSGRRDPAFADARAVMLDVLTTRADALLRTGRPGHFTGSALVVDATATRVLLLFHTKLQRWLQPGGHADGDANLAAVALREATEETGICGLRVALPAIDLDVHEVAPPAEDPHLHLDVRFLVVAPEGADGGRQPRIASVAVGRPRRSRCLRRRRRDAAA